MDYSVAITQLRGHFTKTTSKLLHSSMQKSADHQSRVLSQPYDWQKRWDLVSFRNVRSEEQARVSGGRLFHAHAAATGKALSPRVARRVDGTCSVMVSAERRHRQATISDVGHRLSDRSSRSSEPPSVEDDVDVWRYAIVSCMPETMTTPLFRSEPRWSTHPKTVTFQALIKPSVEYSLYGFQLTIIYVFIFFNT